MSKHNNDAYSKEELERARLHYEEWKNAQDGVKSKSGQPLAEKKEDPK